MTVGMDIVNYLADNGYGTLGSDLFLGYMPDQQNAVVVMETGGQGPYLDYGDDADQIRPSFQVLVRNSNYITGVEKAVDIRSLLMALSNTTINTTTYLYIRATGDVAYLGRKAVAAGETNEFSVNFNTMREV